MKHNSSNNRNVRTPEINYPSFTDNTGNTSDSNETNNKRKPNNTNKMIKIIIGSVLALGAVICGVKLAMTLYAPKPTLTATMNTTASSISDTSINESDIVVPTYTLRTTDQSAEGYVCPADFDYLQSVNEDIYAWIHIEGTYVDFPICQSSDDDSYYLTYNSDKHYSAAGSIFTEHRFNSKDFDDPVTLIYGHHTGSRVMFGDLQRDMTDEKIWESNPVITIYMPDRELRYQIFAGVPYDTSHILYYHDFSNESVYNNFFNDIASIESDDAVFHYEFFPEYDDKVIILSTCYQGTNTRRFLVMGKLIYDSNAGA